MPESTPAPTPRPVPPLHEVRRLLARYRRAAPAPVRPAARTSPPPTKSRAA